MNSAALERVRDLSDRAARAEVARSMGELVMRDSAAIVERGWLGTYLATWFDAFVYFYALERSGDDHNDALEILSTPEVQDEIDTRVRAIVAQIAGTQ